MGKLYIGSNQIKKLFLGTTPIKKLYLGSTLIWSNLGTYTNDFNRPDGALSLTEFDRIIGSGSADLMPRVSGNQLIGPDASGLPTNGVATTFVSPKVELSATNKRVEADLIGPISPVAQAGLIARGNSDLSKTMQFNVVAASHGGISNQDAGVGTNRTSYDQSKLAAGDRIGFEVYGDQYVAYRIRSGVRLNLTAYQDSGGALVPLTATRYGFYVISGKNGSTPVYGSPLDNFFATDLADRVAGDFIESGLSKNGATQAWAGSATWADITGVVGNPLCPGSVVSGNGVTVRGNKTGANFTAAVPFSGGLNPVRTIRIVRVSDGAVIGTGPDTGAVNAGTATCSATANVVDGEVYKLQMKASAANGGSIAANVPLLQIT